MKICVLTYLTLDGVMQAPGGPDEDGEDGFAYGGWQQPLWDDRDDETVHRWLEGVDAFLLGRKTYDIFAGYWPHGPVDSPFTAFMNETPKYVASRSTPELTWEHSQLLGPDAVAAVRELKERPGGDLLVWGSADFIDTLLANDLVDELRLITYPVVLGAGKRLFGTGASPSTWELVESGSSPKGSITHVYRRAGTPTFGKF